MSEMVNYKDIIDAYEDDYEPKAVTLDNGVEILVKQRLSLLDRSRMVDAIAKQCFVETEDGEIEYVPYMREFAINVATIQFFTNIEMPDDIETLANIALNVKLLDAINNKTDWRESWYLSKIIDDADDLIEYKKEKLIKTSKLDGIITAITNLLNSFGEAFKDMEPDEILEKLKELGLPDIT